MSIEGRSIRTNQGAEQTGEGTQIWVIPNSSGQTYITTNDIVQSLGNLTIEEVYAVRKQANRLLMGEI